MSRTNLPHRRPNRTERVNVDGHEYDITLGYDPATGRILEAFIAGPKVGSQLDSILDDASILLSRCLQAGMTAADMSVSMCRLPTILGERSVEPASPIGAALQIIAKDE